MRRVWKYPLKVTGMNCFTVFGARSKVVLAALDPATGAPALWIECDPDGERVIRRFFIEPTGTVVEPGAQHVGSMIDREFVWHVYERNLDYGKSN